jgi:Tfp pilus assembly PilM family ATPase
MRGRFSSGTESRPWPIGLDVSSDGIRMLQFHRVEGRLSVRAGAQWKSIHSHEEGYSPTAAARAVHEIMADGGFAGKDVVSAVDTPDIRIETLRLPEIPPEELSHALLDRTDDLFDIDPSNYFLMALRAGLVVTAGNSYEWILLAVPHEVYWRRCEWLETMGLTVRALRAEPLALYDAVYHQRRRNIDQQSAYAIVRMGQTSTLVVVVHAKRILLIKNIDFGGDRLTAAAANYLGLEFEEANLLRRQIRNDYALHAHQARMMKLTTNDIGATNSILWTVHDALREEANALVLEIGLCLRYCSNMFGTPKIEQMTLAGEGAWDPSIIHLLRENLGARCEGAAPFRSVEVSGCPLFSDRRGSMADWTVCAGLAGQPVSPDAYGVRQQPIQLILSHRQEVAP